MPEEFIDLIDRISCDVPLKKFHHSWFGRCPFCCRGEIKVRVDRFYCATCTPNGGDAAEYLSRRERFE